MHGRYEAVARRSELMNIAQAAKVTGYSKRFIYQAVKERTLACYRSRTTGILYVSMEQLEDWMVWA